MKIVGERIKLAPFDDSDLSLFVDMSMCPVMMEHVYKPFTYSEARDAFDVKSKPWTLMCDGWLSLGITEISTGEKLGNIGLKITNHEAKIAEVCFMVKQSAQRKGIVRDALYLLKCYAFNVLNLNKLVAVCSVYNTGSYKVLEKLGFVREGCLMQNSLINKQFVDDFTYGLCKSMFLLE